MMRKEVCLTMNQINWLEEVLKRKEQFIEDTQRFLQIKSVYDPETISDQAPMGKGIAEALEFMLAKGQEDGFSVKNVDGFAGHIEYGTGSELIGVLCHVDVVPEGDGWTSPPYTAEIREGKIYARGALDDKGPTMAAYYALKIVKELGLPIQKRIRIIIGTDEESNWRCVEHYFKHEETPDIGFAPDADFPIIYAEKGIANFFLTGNFSEMTNEHGAEDIQEALLLSFEAGQRVNMVPDLAEVRLQVGSNEYRTQMKNMFETFLSDTQVKGSLAIEEQIVHLKVEGKSAHGAEPYKGVNAGFLLNQFLEKISLNQAGQRFVGLLQYYTKDHEGKKLGIDFKDEVIGDLTLNVGVIEYSFDKGVRLGLNLRYPASADYEQIMSAIDYHMGPYQLKVTDMDHSTPHYIDQNHPLIKTLQKVYESQTGEEARLLSIGGGTYARSLKTGVAFGPLFPGKEETAHQKDEYVEIDDLLKAIAIYAEALYELGTMDTK